MADMRGTTRASGGSKAMNFTLSTGRSQIEAQLQGSSVVSVLIYKHTGVLCGNLRFHACLGE
jgi:hypothetical protein